MGYVYDTNALPTPYQPWYNSEFNLNTTKSLGQVTIIISNQNFPINIVGTAMIRVKYRTHYAVIQVGNPVMEDCKIGFGGIEIEDSRIPTSELTWRAAFVGITAGDFNWVWNAGESVWEYKCEYTTVLLEDWPPEEYFDITMSHGEWRDWSRQIDVKFNLSDDCIFSLDFDGYADSVFEEDPYNFIEVS